MKYLRYLSMPLLVITAIYFSAKGQYWMWIYLLLLDTIIIGGDALFGSDKSVPDYKYPKILIALLYINLPLIFILVSLSVYMAGLVQFDFLERWVFLLTGEDIAFNRSLTAFWHLVGYVFSGGLMIGSAATVPGHELIHHKKNKRDWFMGQWMLAFSWDCAFAIEHVHGHHKNVGLASDPATAKRGENIYRFFLKASCKEHLDAWAIELSRLRKYGYKIAGIHNRMIHGYIKSLFITIWAFYLGGWKGVVMFFGLALFAKFFLEVVNYMEHYGLVRAPGTPVSPRHSWNTNKRLSSVLLYNLTRHSHHHEQGSLEFWKLRPHPDAPDMPYGYLSTLYLVIFFPGMYRKMMEPRLSEWFENFATDEEKALMA